MNPIWINVVFVGAEGIPPGGWMTRGIVVGMPEAAEVLEEVAVSDGWYRMLV